MIKRAKKNKPIKWIKIFTRYYSVHFITAAISSLAKDKNLLRKPLKHIISIPEPGGQSLYVDEIEYRELMQALDRYYVGDYTKLKAFNRRFFAAGKKYIRRSKNGSRNLASISGKVLIGCLTAFTAGFEEYGKYLWLTFFINDLLSKKIVKMIGSLQLEDAKKKELIAYAMRPSKLSSAFLLNHEARNKNLKLLAKKFRWITALDVYDHPATIKDIRAYLAPGEEASVHIPKTLSQVSKAARNWITLSRETTYAKDVRDDFRRQAMLEAFPLFDETGRRLAMQRRHLAYLTTPEIIKGLLGKISSKALKEKAALREKEGFMMIMDGRKLEMADGSARISERSGQIGLAVLTKKKQRAEELHGIVGCPGKAKGRAKIIFTVRDLGKVKKGDIMCSVTTNPNYVPAMRRARAFVTDEGGMTSHAAIVAREMGKPCLVGTKQATKAFRDGDLLEVNATKGIVKKL